MNKMDSLHFTPQFNAASFSFDDILESAKKHIGTLSDSKQTSLKESLENGLANLSTKEELDMYISSYGDIHRQKLQMAFEKIPYNVWHEGEISVIDYGCGQCIAEMVLSDFMKSHFIDRDIITDFIVIEPSKPSLNQGIEYLKRFFDDTDITAYNMTAGSLTYDNIHPKANTVIHIFSNVLDIVEFERDVIADILNQDMCHNHILVCVSPFYQENGRGALMDDFAKMLRGMRNEYTLEKHTDDWNKPFSCQICIFVSAYY